MFFSRRRKKKGRRGNQSAGPLRSRKPQFESLEDRNMLSAAQIIAENALPGTPETEWDIYGTASANIEGYAVQFSVNHGETVQFKIDTDANDYRLDIYRMGWYQGLGARKVATVQPSNLQSQPSANFNNNLNMADASNWHVSASWAVPTNAVSGVYMAKLTREDGVYGENMVLFVVRDDEGHSDMIFQTSDTSWQAYNTWGGSSLYTPNYPAGRALAVSYNRPFANFNSSPLNYYFAEEMPMTRFLERNGFDVSYTSGIDTDRRGSELLEHKVFLSVGHDEYWSGQQRANVEAARDAGVNLAFFSGNEMYWKTRWVADATGNPYGTLVSYKETLAGAKIDPLAGVWTGTWRDPRFAATTDGGVPENALTGTIFTVNSNGDLGSTIDVQSEFAALRFWRNTEVASLTGNQSLSLGDRALGYEWDEDLDNGFRPAGLIPLSSTTRNVAQYLLDYGATYGKGTATHSMTMYRASSGALVFSAGSIQYAWALDDLHSVYNTATDHDLQQATINLFADMGVQPGSLMAGIVRAVASSDLLKPTSTITSPTAGATLPSSGDITIRGTAQDRGGGVIAVVEVSTDGGLSWHRATGRESWTYTFTTRGSGQFSILSRAVDDSGNMETNGPRVDVNPVTNPGVYSLWRDSDSPATADVGEGNSIELGLRFTSDVNGTITGVRFYKSSANTGTHTAHLWTNTGQLLASATFTNESGSGWQQVNFAAPVPVMAGVTYIASYFAPNGHFSVDRGFFSSEGINNGPIHALPNGPSGSNGVFKYSNSSVFPDQSFNASNYWVDVVLNTNTTNDTTAPTVTSFANADGSPNVTTDTSVVIKFSEAVNVATLNASTVQLLNPDPNSIPGGCCSTPGGWCSGCPLLMGANTRVISATLTYDAALHTVTVTPTSPLDTSSIYTVVVHGGVDGVKDLAGNSVTADTASSFLTPDRQASIASSVWNDSTTPGTVDSGDNQSVELGMKFTADANGMISGIRFYKSAANTGVHTGSLWSSSGQLLATGTFSGETASGWQQLNFATPVTITAGTTYIASYHTNSGHYAVNRNYFTTQLDSGLLHVPINGGMFLYGAGGFPTQTLQSSNYWVDVVLRTAPPLLDGVPPEVAAFTPAAGATNVAVNASTTVRFSEAMDPTSITTGTVRLMNGGNLVPVSLVYNPATMTVSLTTSAPLAFGANYTIVVMGGASGVKDASGNAIAQTTTSDFATVAAPIVDNTAPTVTGTSPANGSINVSVNGTFTVRFSEGLNAATVDINRILLLKNATNRVTAGVSYDAATNTVTITPAAALEFGTNYTIFAIGGTTGVRDLSGNAMDADFVSTFTTAAPTVAASLWPNTTTPGTVDVGEASALEVGVKFVADTSGFITGLRFYKSAANTGTHVAHLWSSTGQLLSTATFTGETASGWQQVNFATPVAVTAGTTYVASYFAPNGHFSVNRNAFNTAFTSGHLSVPANGGVFKYGTTSAFPNQTNQASNYWVDVVLSMTPPADTTPPTVASAAPASGATNVAIGASATVRFSEAMNALTISNSTVKILDGNSIVTANVVYDSNTNTVTVTPTSPLSFSKTYTITVVGGFQGVKDTAGNALAQNFTSTFTTVGVTPLDTTAPTLTNFSPTNAATNVATSVAPTITFSEPMNAATIDSTTIRLMDGTTQVAASVSYNSANNTATITPTAALSNSKTYTISITGGASGVKDLAGNALAQTATSTFTTVAAVPVDTTPPTVTGFSPANGATNVATSVSLTVSFSEALNAASVTTSTVRLLDGTTQVTASVSYNAGNNTVTITPSAALGNSKTYTISILGGASGVKDSAGNALAQTATSSFTTVAAVASTFSIWPNTTTPGTVDVGESTSLEVGVKFVADASGYITGLRFYKSAANTGTHVGHLWTSTGQLLATVTFTNETASGWQQVNFATPVAITAGTTYVASYFAPNGHFSVNRNSLSTGLASGHLSIPASGGVFQYGTSSAFPNTSYNASNYWVDVVLSLAPPVDTTAPTVASTTPSNGASSVATSATASVTFSEAINAATITSSSVRLLDGATQVAASLSYNAANNTVTITPNAVLSNSKTYTISILGGASGIKDVAGNALAQTFTATFTTAAAPPVDTTPPTVSSVSPASGATNVATSATMTVTFSEALNAATVGTSTVRLLDGSTQVSASVTYNSSNNIVTITPNAVLSNLKTYTISVLGGAAGVKDLAGNSLAQTFTSTFSTVPSDSTAPTVTSVNPANNAKNVAVTATLSITFSESLNAATITSGTVRLFSGTTQVSATVTYNASTKTVTIIPTARLTNNKTYTISILGGIGGVADLAGNTLAQTFTSAFTTVRSGHG